MQRLAKDADTIELIEMYRAAATVEQPTLEDVAVGYAALVAITLKDQSEAIESLKQLPKPGLDWGSHMVELFIARMPVLQLDVADLRLPAIMSDESNFSANTSANSIVIYGATSD